MTKPVDVPPPGKYIVIMGVVLGGAAGCAVPWILPAFTGIILGAIPGMLLAILGGAVGAWIARPIALAINESSDRKAKANDSRPPDPDGAFNDSG